MIRRQFDENGDYTINKFVSGSPATIQAVTTRLRLFKGEWFLNINSGVPWYQRVFIKPARLNEIDRIIRNTILQTEGVERLSKFDLVFDSSTRKLSVDFAGSTIYDDGNEFEDVVGLNPLGV